jgi:hypothetical protein
MIQVISPIIYPAMLVWSVLHWWIIPVVLVLWFVGVFLYFHVSCFVYVASQRIEIDNKDD